MMESDGVDRFENYDITRLCTPIKADVLENLLKQTKYDEQKTKYLVDGFTRGFDIGYRGPTERKDHSANIPITVGSKLELWNKVMKEVKLKRYAGPFEEVPFPNFMQSPIGLVPKDGGKQTRLIFHLSYDFKNSAACAKGEKRNSLNYFTPDHLCSVKYNDLDHAVQNCLKLIDMLRNKLGNKRFRLVFAQTDVRSAFRLVPVLPSQFCWLVMCAEDPTSGKKFYFIDKCLPFGASISCAIFQAFSDAIAHILRVWARNRSQTEDSLSNYLDDFLFISFAKQLCDELVQEFLRICKLIGCPIAEEKTVWGTERIIFLGIMLDGIGFVLAIPEEKRLKAVNMIKWMLDRKTVKIKQIQQLAGTLNFLCRAIFPGRAFLRRIYDKTKTASGFVLQRFHHIRVDHDLKQDCLTWLGFLENRNKQLVLNRPFVDLKRFETATTLNFFTDSSANGELGFGAVFNRNWFFGQWEPGFVKECEPSIEYLELAALCMGILTWSESLKNMRVIVFCDNQAVVHMVNNSTSKCRNCMILLRILIADNLLRNRRVFVHWVSTKNNKLADSLSRLKV